jgi:ferritin-like metal-binding protein YciE/DNA-binding MarR family transcriptional regulator
MQAQGGNRMATAVVERTAVDAAPDGQRSLLDRVMMAAADPQQWSAMAGMLRALTSSLLDAVSTRRHEPIERYGQSLAFAADSVAAHVGDKPVQGDARYVLGRLDALLDLSDVAIDRSVATRLIDHAERRAHAREILAHLYQMGEMRASDLARAVGIEPNYLSNILRWMEDADLVRRTAAGRTKLVSLGAKGEAVYLALVESDPTTSVQPATEHLLERLCETMSLPAVLADLLPRLRSDELAREERARLASQLRALLDQIDPQPDTPATWPAPALLPMLQDWSSSHDVFVLGLSNALCTEHHILRMLPEFQDRARLPEVRQALHRHEQETRQQVQNLHQALQDIGIHLEAANWDVAEDLNAELRACFSPFVLEVANLGGAVATKPYEASMYASLVQMADDLGATEAAQLLRQNLAQDTEMASWVEEMTHRLALHSRAAVPSIQATEGTEDRTAEPERAAAVLAT